MHIKKFTGPSVKETIKAVKAEFGDDALILSTKRIQTGVYEVVASVDYDLTKPVDVDISKASGS
ncbi:MAG: flagellar biosynthesis protein FlhF, partial [Deltaproteobacteria bacterium]